MATAKTNGAATATTATKKAGVSATRKTTTTKSAQDKTPVIQAVNVDNRIKTIQKLMEWSRQRERLHETRNELSAFSFGSDQLKDKLEITDSTGRTFSTSNSNLIAALTAHFQELLIAKIDSVEQKLVNATI